MNHRPYKVEFLLKLLNHVRRRCVLLAGLPASEFPEHCDSVAAVGAFLIQSRKNRIARLREIAAVSVWIRNKFVNKTMLLREKVIHRRRKRLEERLSESVLYALWNYKKELIERARLKKPCALILQQRKTLRT